MPIRYLTGDLLADDAEALVNPVNCVGVMGKGLAKQFKAVYPEMFRAYQTHCERGRLMPGGVHVWTSPRGKLIVNLATKAHWRRPSRYRYIEDGLLALTRTIRDYGITSIAMPKLGCGHGGLNWIVVQHEIERYLRHLDCDIRVYGPEPDHGPDKEITQ